MSLYDLQQAKTARTGNAAGLIELIGEGYQGFGEAVGTGGSLLDSAFEKNRKKQGGAALEALGGLNLIDLAARKASGGLSRKAIESEYGKISDADFAKVSGLEQAGREKETATITWRNTVDDEKERPLKAEFNRLLGQGLTKEAEEYIKTGPGAGIRDTGSMFGQVNDTIDKNKVRADRIANEGELKKANEFVNAARLAIANGADPRQTKNNLQKSLLGITGWTPSENDSAGFGFGVLDGDIGAKSYLSPEETEDMNIGLGALQREHTTALAEFQDKEASLAAAIPGTQSKVGTAEWNASEKGIYDDIAANVENPWWPRSDIGQKTTKAAIDLAIDSGTHPDIVRRALTRATDTPNWIQANGVDSELLQDSIDTLEASYGKAYKDATDAYKVARTNTRTLSNKQLDEQSVYKRDYTKNANTRVDQPIPNNGSGGPLAPTTATATNGQSPTTSSFIDDLKSSVNLVPSKADGLQGAINDVFSTPNSAPETREEKQATLTQEREEIIAEEKAKLGTLDNAINNKPPTVEDKFDRVEGVGTTTSVESVAALKQDQADFAKTEILDVLDALPRGEKAAFNKDNKDAIIKARIDKGKIRERKEKESVTGGSLAKLARKAIRYEIQGRGKDYYTEVVLNEAQLASLRTEFPGLYEKYKKATLRNK